VSLIEKLREKLDRLKERFEKGDRRGIVLGLLAVARLKKRGEPITRETLCGEARKIMEEHPEVDWGIDECTPGYVSTLIRELEEMGVLEETPAGTYIVRRYSNGDPVSEIYARFGYLLLYGGPAR